MTWPSNNNGTSEDKLIFSQNTYEKISRVVYELRVRLKADLCIFADVNGYPVDHSGETNNIDVSDLTAVAAGSFLASNEMSRLISGEPYFDHVFHEGQRKNSYMCNVNSDYLMIIVFNKKVPVGLVRLLTHHAVERLNTYLDNLKDQNRQVANFLDSKFRDQLNDELDKAFG